MNKIRGFLWKMDVLLACIVLGMAAEHGVKHFINRIENTDNQPVMNVVSKESPDRNLSEPYGDDGEISSGDTSLPSKDHKERSFDKTTQDLVKKKVALTFDDGPNADYTEMLLAGLKERGVCATFFLLGKEVDRLPDIVEQMHEDGHLIGNHSYEHVNLGALSDEAAIAQVDETNEAIYNVTGEYPEYIRPPFGSWKKNLDYETTMIEVLWDVDPLDWKTENTDRVVKRVLKNVKADDIILLHDASESSVNAAFQIIDKLTAEGYMFVTVDEILFD